MEHVSDYTSKKRAPSVESLSPEKVRRVLYRPLDYRWLYNDRDWVDWYREDLQQVYERLGEVPTLITVAGGQGGGPAVSHSLVLPDQHAFLGHRGGRAIWSLWLPIDFPTENWRNLDPRMIVGEKRTGFSLVVVEWLERIGRSQDFDDAYSYILAALSASNYTRRNWLALDTDELRVPLTEDLAVFDRGVEIGRALRDAWELKTPSEGLRWTGSSAESIGKAEWRNGAIHFAGDRVLHGVSEEAWKFKISGYRVLPSWFKARESWRITIAHASEAQSVCAAASQLVVLSEQANEILGHYPPAKA